MISDTFACNALLPISFLNRERALASKHNFMPRGTIRCRGIVAFRSQAVRDAACLFDTDRTIHGWSCLPEIISWHDHRHVPDFAVERSSGVTLVEVTPTTGTTPPSWASAAAKDCGHRYDVMAEAAFMENHRLTNAREMLRYAAYDVSLGDRVRLLSFLDEHGPAPLAACMSVIRNGRDPVGALAALALRRFIDIEIDETLLGPDTMVSRFRA